MEVRVEEARARASTSGIDICATFAAVQRFGHAAAAAVAAAAARMTLSALVAAIACLLERV